jgi:hypothetical protein
MATQLQTVNRILVRLREDEVSTVAASAYSKLIATFVNDAKEELEDMWFWTANESEIDTSILSDGTRVYDLTTTTDRSFLVRQVEDQSPLAFDITDGQEGCLFDIPLKQLQEWRESFKGTPDDVAQPNIFAIKPDSDGRGYSIEMQQGSSTARTWRSHWYIPQAILATDGTDDNTVIILPERPIYLRALFTALNERGEEMGEPGGVAERRSEFSAAAAMELDTQVHKKSDEKDMTNLERLRNATLGEFI